MSSLESVWKTRVPQRGCDRKRYVSSRVSGVSSRLKSLMKPTRRALKRWRWSAELDEVVRRQRAAELLKLSAFNQTTEVYRRETGFLEQSAHVLLGGCIISGEKQDAPPSGLMWIACEYLRPQRVHCLDHSRAGSQ